jgi:hypothetical protein
VRGHLERSVEQRLVRHETARFDAARRGQHELRFAVVDPRRKLGRREPPEHHGVDRAQASAREHREDRLRHHRHIDHDGDAAANAEGVQPAGEARDLVP